MHVLGEADFGLDSQRRNNQDPDEIEAAGKLLQDRLAAVQEAEAAGDRQHLERYLISGRWEETGEPGSGEPGSGEPPLPRALAAFGDVARLVLLATKQRKQHGLDTVAAAGAVRAALRRFPDLLGIAVPAVDVARVERLDEQAVLEAVGPILAEDGGREDRGAVTWGPGATQLALAAATALAQAGIPWGFVDVPKEGRARVVDPLLEVDPDPVVALLLRWRMFRSLEDLSGGERAPVRLTAEQRDVVAGLARRWERGHEEVAVDALRGLVADAVVRGDGTAGFAVRRYVEARYQEWRAGEPGAVDLLAWARDNGSGPELGRRLEYLRGPQAREQLPPDELDRPSAGWLLGEAPSALNNLGKNSSHQLRAVPPELAQKVARELGPAPGGTTGEHDDGERLRRVGLPEAPVMPGLTVFVTWVVGRRPGPHGPAAERATIGAQVLAEELGQQVRDHLGIPRGSGTARENQDARAQGPVGLQVLLLATPDSEEEAEAQKRELGAMAKPPLFNARNVKSRVEVIPSEASAEEIEQRLEALVTEQTGLVAQHGAVASSGLGAVVVVPTGLKNLVLPLVRAAWRESARRGVPLFLRELAGRDGQAPQMHRWPTMTAGDLPLLVAAREAADGLELDVAWRLLSATSLAGSLAVRYRELRNAFVCDEADDPDSWPERLPAPVPNRVERTVGLLGERLRMVRDALAHASAPAQTGGRGLSPAVRTRYLMLAAATVEATVAATSPRSGKRVLADFRLAVGALAPEMSGESWDVAVRPLLVLDAARNAIPITHGAEGDPDEAVRKAAASVEKVEAAPAEGGAETSASRGGRRDRSAPGNQLTDVPSLIEAAASAADSLFTLAPGAPGILQDLHTELGAQLNREIQDRAASRPGGSAGRVG